MPTISNGLIAATDAPSYISARSANSLISESRPTRIQAEALLVINRFLDELLLLILSSAKSLATDRIKTDGILKVLNNNLLAKDAVLEAELELRSYVEAKRAEGAKVPLGLMATSRLDGTDNFPVNSAYNALRIRCQYYSTLGDREDDSAATDQNIMSSDGRPIATITPGVAIYVTALLEYVGEHILKNVARVIERDNSDEASLYDLRAAITEDELLSNLFSRMTIKEEMARRIEILEARRRKVVDDGSHRGVKADARAVKPWQVPTDGDFDEAAGPALFSAKRASIQPTSRTDLPRTSQHERAASSSVGYSKVSSLRDSMNTAFSHAPSSFSNGSDSVTPSRSTAMTSTNSSEGMTGSIGRRQSSDRSWSGMLGNMKRRNSIRQSSEASGSLAKTLSPSESSAPSEVRSTDADLEPQDDFEALMLSGQTMKVSLTPNRLRTIEVEREAKAQKNAVRRRPGTATVASAVRDDAAAGSFASSQSSSETTANRSGVNDIRVDNESSTSPVNGVSYANGLVRRPSSRASLQAPTRPEKKFAAPPSSYRSPSPALIGMQSSYSRDGAAGASMDDDRGSLQGSHRSNKRLQPRDGQGDRVTSSQELADFFKSTPPSATSETFSAISFEANKKSGMGDRVRSLFGRKSSSSGHMSPSSPQRQSTGIVRNDTKTSWDGSHDTSLTSTNNSMEQSRAIASPVEMPATKERALPSRPSTSTSEHPPIIAPATHEPKPSPGVTVTEAVNGGAAALGIAGVATGVVSAGKNPSASGRSPSRTHSIPESIEESSPQTGSGTIGIYEESSTGEAQASPSLKPRAPEEIQSRKVPWGYKRNSSSTVQTTVERNVTPTSDRRRSVGYQSSGEHATSLIARASRGSSDHGHSPSSITHAGDENPTVKTPVLVSQAMMRRGSATQESLSASKSSTSYPQQRRSHQAEVVQLLAELEKSMRSCSSVEECRELVLKAMHADRSVKENRAAGLQVVSSEDADPATTNGTAKTTDNQLSGVSDKGECKKVATTCNGVIPDSSAGKEDDSTSLEKVDQGLVVAWLLGGDDTPAFSVKQNVDKDLPAIPATKVGIAEQVNGIEEGERSVSFDSNHATKQSTEEGSRKPSSSAASVQSHYKDAEDVLPTD